MPPIDLPAQPLPAGLPDAAALAQLASEFLRALPGATPASAPSNFPSGLQPAGLSLPPGASSGPATPAAVPLVGPPPGANLLPTDPRAPADVAARAPVLLPHAQAGNGVPENVLTSAPALDGRLGGTVLSVPQIDAAPAPRMGLGGIPAPVPDGPSYYFLDAPAQGPAVAARPLEHLLPGAALLAPPPLAPAPELPTPAAPARPAAAAPHYYFLGAPGHGVPQAATDRHPPFDVNAVRRDFPILAERVNGRQLVWFDNAATTQKPQVVIDRLAHFYAHENSNIHRAAHELAARATDAYEQARETVRRFLGASSTEEIIFVRGTTEGINLVAKSWGARHVGPGDEIIVSHLEHHANIVPWQQLAAEKGARLRVIPVDDSGQVLLEEYQRLLSDRTRLVAVTQVSNALGTVVPVQRIVELAHRAGALALVDGAQSVSHLRVDLRALDADFFVFSGHKIFGPTGIGVVYGKRDILEDMPPWQGGGNMITDVTFERTSYQAPPARFEAGTGNIADAVGLGAALEYVERLGLENIGRYEHALLDYATVHMRAIEGVRLIGTAADKASVLSFVLDGATTEEVGNALNEEGIAVRTGHHCAQPILRRFGLETSVRPRSPSTTPARRSTAWSRSCAASPARGVRAVRRAERRARRTACRRTAPRRGRALRAFQHQPARWHAAKAPARAHIRFSEIVLCALHAAPVTFRWTFYAEVQFGEYGSHAAPGGRIGAVDPRQGLAVPRPALARAAGARRAHRTQRGHRAGDGRDRHRQGTRRTPHPQGERPRRTVRRRQLRRLLRESHRRRALRPRGRRLHRRAAHAPGMVRGGQRRHAVPRRDR
jgi:cysteine desulfurase/selenocysteine lyase